MITCPGSGTTKLVLSGWKGKIFGDVAIDLEMRLSVEDSPNSAGVVIDMIRCARLALDRGEAGPLRGPSAFFCKHPPEQFTDDEAFYLVSEFVKGHEREPRSHVSPHLVWKETDRYRMIRDPVIRLWAGYLCAETESFVQPV